MKVLELAPYVFVENHPHGMRNQSGLAYMIRSICDMLAMDNEVHVLTQSLFTSKQYVSGWLLVRRNLFSIIFHFKFRYLLFALQMRKKETGVSFIRVLLYSISAGQVEDYINSWKPDVVHIHGVGMYTLPYYYAASICNIPVVSTLHGLLSFHSIVPASSYQRKVERAFLELFINNKYSLSFISSGMKKKVQEWSKSDCTNITVIPNAFRKVEWESIIDIRKGKKIICVGSLYPLKNQIQVIRILPKVQNAFSDTSMVYLDVYGDGESLLEWQKYVEDNHIDGVSFRGRQPQDLIFNALYNSDLLVFPSIEEGFGIPIIEAYSCGVPVVTFKDLDSAQDIYNDECCLFADNRTDDALALAIIGALSHDWDRRKIVSFSQSFSIDSISHRYSNCLSGEHKPIDIHFFKSFINKINND